MGRSQDWGYVVTFLFLTSKWTWQACTLRGAFFTFGHTLCSLLDRTPLPPPLPGTLTLPCPSTSALCCPRLWQKMAPKQASFLLHFCVGDRTSLCLRQNLTMLACDAFSLPDSFTLHVAIIFIHSLFLCSIKKKIYDLVSSLLLWQNHSGMIQSNVGEERVYFCFQVTVHHWGKSKAGTCRADHGGTARPFKGWCLDSLDSDALVTVPRTRVGPFTPINNQDNLPQTYPQAKLIQELLHLRLPSQETRPVVLNLPVGFFCPASQFPKNHTETYY